jgi:hypothetical protein
MSSRRMSLLPRAALHSDSEHLWYGELKTLIFYQICCCFSWSFVCVGCFETPKLPVSILKRNNRNKRLVSDSAETSFSSSFGCFDTKLVLEDTLINKVTLSLVVFSYFVLWYTPMEGYSSACKKSLHAFIRGLKVTKYIKGTVSPD